MRVTGTLWSLDTDLARCRHFPAIQWQTSYSLYDHRSWYDEHVSQEWSAQVQEATQILQKENELQTVIQLVGPEALPESEKAILLTGRILREDFLQQSAYHPIDAFCPLEKQFWMLKVILAFHHSITNSVESGARVEDVADKSLLSKIAAMKTWPNDGFEEKAKELMKGADETSALQSAVQSNE
jgi:V/A-type H+-transporting ATPase subunit A